MKCFVNLLSFLLYMLVTNTSFAQGSYTDSIALFRQHYKRDFLKDQRSPLKAKDTAFLCFYAPNPRYRVTATLKMTPQAETFDMPTHSGKTQKYRTYATARFYIRGRAYTLNIYKNEQLSKKPEMAGHLFLPFNDLTNYETTYGGGRYIDLDEKDIRDSKILIDFNKCYNPYCAFASGYSCPIPPVENRLKTRIEAGEQLFDRPVKE